MLEAHAVFKLPCSETGKLWRYMDFTKFVAMLEDNSLWFSRPDKLNDPFDCEVSSSEIDRQKAEILVYTTTAVAAHDDIYGPMPMAAFEAVLGGTPPMP